MSQYDWDTDFDDSHLVLEALHREPVLNDYFDEIEDTHSNLRKIIEYYVQESTRSAETIKELRNQIKALVEQLKQVPTKRRERSEKRNWVSVEFLGTSRGLRERRGGGLLKNKYSVKNLKQ